MVERHTDLMWELLSFGEAAMGMSLYATCSFLVVGYEYISVAAVMAAIGSALTAGHFWKRAVRVKVPVALVLLRLTHCALNFRAFWVQIHRICQLPVACPGTPAARISFSGIFI